METPETRYAVTDDGLHLAYQSFGHGPDVVFIPPLASNVEMAWELERYRMSFEYLARRIHVVQFDKRGIGASDRFDDVPTLEQRMGDVAAVMDAVGVESATLVGSSEGGLMAQLFAARHPERVERLVLINTVLGGRQYAKASDHWRDGDPPLPTFAEKQAQFARLGDTWGRDGQYGMDMFTPSYGDDAVLAAGMARFQRQCASPTDLRRQVESLYDMDGVDLAEIRCPTLVVVASGDRVVPSCSGRWLADNVVGARLHELDSNDHYGWAGDAWRELSDVVLEFVLGASMGAASSTRRFATILFTDLVDSTSRSSSAGDREWHEVKESHDRVARKVIGDAGGTVVKSTGDGVLATFDVPSIAIGAARSLRSELGGLGLPIRAGLHAGEVEVHDDGDVSGVAVNLASRVEGAADTGEILVSSTVRELAMGSDWTFLDRGESTLKGIDGTWRLYALEG